MTTCLKAFFLLIAGSASVFAAPGIVNFANSVLPFPPDRLVFDTTGQPLIGTNFIAQLLYETAPNSFTAHPELAGFRSDPTPFPGTWIGGSRTLSGAGGFGIPVRMQIRAWDGGFGAIPLTFDEAIATGNHWGVSDIFTYTEGISIGAPDPRDRWMWNFQGFQLVPEPSTWALLAFGAGFLCWRCRRKPAL